MICRFLEKIWSRSWNDVSRLCCECYTVLFRNTSCGQASRSNFRTFPRKKIHILHENFEAHHLIQHGQYLRILLERWTKKFTYVPTTYHYIIKQNFCCHCIVDIKLQSQTVSRINKKCMSSNQRRQILKNDDIPTVKYVRFIKCSSISSELNNNWDDISMCYKVQFLTTNNEDKYSNNASTFYY